MKTIDEFDLDVRFAVTDLWRTPVRPRRGRVRLEANTACTCGACTSECDDTGTCDTCSYDCSGGGGDQGTNDTCFSTCSDPECQGTNDTCYSTCSDADCGGAEPTYPTQPAPDGNCETCSEDCRTVSGCTAGDSTGCV
jgi:hypothetical protein